MSTENKPQSNAIFFYLKYTILFLIVFILGCIALIIKFGPANLGGKGDSTDADSAGSGVSKSQIDTDLHVDIFSLSGMTFIFYCSSNTGKVRLRQLYTQIDVSESDAAIQPYIDDYNTLPEEDHLQPGAESIVTVGHEGASHEMLVNGVRLYIVGDNDNVEQAMTYPNADYIYVPCTRKEKNS